MMRDTARMLQIIRHRRSIDNVVAQYAFSFHLCVMISIGICLSVCRISVDGSIDVC